MRQFYGHLESFLSFCTKTSMSIKFLVFGGGGGFWAFFGAGGVPLLFLWVRGFFRLPNELLVCSVVDFCAGKTNRVLTPEGMENAPELSGTPVRVFQSRYIALCFHVSQGIAIYPPPPQGSLPWRCEVFLPLFLPPPMASSEFQSAGTGLFRRKGWFDFCTEMKIWKQPPFKIL